MANVIVVSCGRGRGNAAIVRSSKWKTTKRMQAGDTHGYTVPDGGNLRVERVGSAPVAVRNDSERSATLAQTKLPAVTWDLNAGKAYQLPEHASLVITFKGGRK